MLISLGITQRIINLMRLGSGHHRADGHAGADDPAEPGVSAAP